MRRLEPPYLFIKFIFKLYLALIHDVVNVVVHGMLLLFWKSKKINRRNEDRKKREKIYFLREKISRFTEA